MSVRESQARLKKIAEQITTGARFDPDDRDFLAKALYDISNGDDADVALNVKARRGERKGPVHRSRQYNDVFMYGLIASAIAPEHDGGLGMTVKDAVSMIKQEFPNLPAEESIRRMWSKIKDSDPRNFDVKAD